MEVHLSLAEVIRGSQVRLTILEQITWTVLTFCLCRCTSARQIYALRFFVGEQHFTSQFSYLPFLSDV